MRRVSLRIKQLYDYHLVPNCFQGMLSSSLVCCVELGSLEDFTSEQLAAVRQIIDDVNAGKPLFPEQPVHST